MPAEFRWIMTALGLSKRAAAEVGGAPIDMRTAQFVVGDGNGGYHEPEEMLPDGVIHEVWRGPINRVYVHQLEANMIVCEAIIPLDAGPFDIREAHIEDAAGDVIAVGKYPLISKPAPASGAARIEYVRGGFRVSNGGETVLQIDSTQIMATQEYVDQHAALTSPHSATHLAQPERLLVRDAAGRAKVAAPAAVDDIARKDTVDNHAALTSPHSATSAATPSRMILRDAAGRAKVAAPAAVDDIARKDTVDNHAALTSPHSATSAATPSRMILRDADGRAKVAAPSAADDIARLAEVETRAPLISPSLGGLPTCPTAPSGTNTDQMASTAFVTAAMIAGTVGNASEVAPGVIEIATQNEVATGTDDQRAVTPLKLAGQAGTTNPLMDGAGAVGISKKFAREDHCHPTDTTQAPVNSPGLTGAPTAPTAAVDTATSQLATTAFVIGQAGGAAPAMDGAATVGTSKRFAREDHKHPSDTSRASATEVTDHINNVAAHSSTSAATPSRLMMRDAAGRAKVAIPVQADDIARLDTVDVRLSSFTGTNQSKMPNGYQMLPGGIIIQWGESAGFNGGDNIIVPHTFPLAFPTACLQVIVGTKVQPLAVVGGNLSQRVAHLEKGSVTLQGFSWHSDNVGEGSEDIGMTFFAVGY